MPTVLNKALDGQESETGRLLLTEGHIVRDIAYRVVQFMLDMLRLCLQTQIRSRFSTLLTKTQINNITQQQHTSRGWILRAILRLAKETANFTLPLLSKCGNSSTLLNTTACCAATGHHI